MEADTARRATGRYLNEANARADGYVPQPEDRPVCTDPSRGNGAIEYANRELLDDGELDASRPEVLLYQPTDGGARQLVALQYRPAEGQAGGELFARQVGGPLNVWLFLYNPAGLFAEGNPNSSCRPGPAPEVTARAPQDGPPPGTSPPGVPGGPPGGGGGPPPGEEGGPPPGQEGGPPPGEEGGGPPPGQQ